MMRSTVALVLLGLCSSVSVSAQWIGGPGGERALAEQSLESRAGEVYLREADLGLATAAIEAMHRRFPRTREIRPSPDGLPEVELTEAAWRTVQTRARATGAPYVLKRTGLRGLDSLDAALGIREVRVEMEGRPVLVPLVTRPANPDALARLFQRLPEVRAAYVPARPDPGEGVAVRLQGGAVEIRLWRGWGDCPSGCMHHHTWEYRYDPRTRSVRLVRESGDPVPSGSWNGDAWG